jgi:DNA polymerase
MTGEQKNKAAAFLDMTAAYLTSGYTEGTPSYSFEDDVEGAVSAAPALTSDVTLTVDAIAAEIAVCTGCQLCKTRTKTVPGEGVETPLALVVGEGPGADEDASGRPFVGKAGQLLDKMLASIGLYRDKNCFIANVVKCRPPGNRDPLPEETAACSGFLARQLVLLQPRAILSVGRVPTQTLLKTSGTISRLRGHFVTYHDAAGRAIPFLPTFHPSYLLRDESQKRFAWEDLKLLRDRIFS